MKSFIFLLASLCMAHVGSAQTITKQYYRDQSLKKEVQESDAKYLKKITVGGGDTVSSEVIELKSGKIISRNMFSGSEPIGIWIDENNSRNKVLDYNFKLIYCENLCQQDSMKTADTELVYLEKLDQKIQDSINIIIGQNIQYPKAAIDNGIEGEVMISMCIDENGKTSHFVISKSVDKSLDREAMRVIRMIQNIYIKQMHDKKVRFCTKIPIKFVMQ